MSLLRPLRGLRGSYGRFSRAAFVAPRRGFHAGESNPYIEAMYESWKADSKSVHPSWDAYFRGISSGQPDWEKQVGSAISAAASAAAGKPSSASAYSPHPPASLGSSGIGSHDHAGVLHLIAAYQLNGHLIADLDPLKLRGHPSIKELDIRAYGFTEQDLNKHIDLRGWGVNALTGLLGSADVVGNRDGKTTLGELVEFLRTVYCGKIGVEYMNISDLGKRNWIRNKLERPYQAPSEKERLTILERLAFADRFEHFLATKWNTAKRFGVEGLETLVPGMRTMIDEASLHGVEHIVIGMPHRGRLNVLANVVKKPMEMIFKEFAGTNVPQADDWSGSGDVKYHLGTSYSRRYPDGREIHLSLLANPSHLEAVNPVVVGKAKAKMHFYDDPKGEKVMAVLLHGDAAFAGQGVVYETMQMSQLRAYGTGGTIHVICNNQIGFTTDTKDGRSTTYSSDLGKAFDAPVFHVNADSPEDVCNVFKLAFEYRQEYHTDVIVDIIGYRRYGHNELDQPSFTQPEMYQRIASHPPVLESYSKNLETSRALSKEQIKGRIDHAVNTISKAYEKSSSYTISPDFWMSTPWDHKQSTTFGAERKILGSGHPDTGLSKATYDAVSSGLTTIPDGFKLHQQSKKTIDAKKKGLDSGTGLDWATAEALAFGSLLIDGVHVRLTGQDVERGTFSHRHAVLHDQKSNKTYTPLQHIPGAKEKFSIYNSLLSEFGVLGFELGVSLESPNQLVLWEAQFGDFANGAQIIIDNFITSGEAKWMRQSGLTLLLPHGYDGQGPEHSSCKIERFLQNADEDPDTVPKADAEGQIQKTNWQIINCTTPANYFHALRRQVYRPFRKPLIVASPKNLLRHRLCVSKKEDIMEGTSFHRLIREVEPDKLVKPEKIRRVIFCSGKIYYELLEARQSAGIKDVAIIRLEQIAPFPFDKVARQMQIYSNAELVWVQEEPKNMGAWYFVQDRLMTATRVINGKEIRPAYIGRRTMASPAVGYGKVHAKEQQKIVEDALSDRAHSYGHGRKGANEV